jgi:hypothetical protein
MGDAESMMVGGEPATVGDAESTTVGDAGSMTVGGELATVGDAGGSMMTGEGAGKSIDLDPVFPTVGAN